MRCAELESLILSFLAQIRQGELTEEESRRHLALMTIAIHVRELADVIVGDLVDVVSALRGVTMH